MASAGKVFGTSGEVYSLGKLAQTCLEAISATNEKGKSLIGNLSGSTTDKALDEAQSVVDEADAIVASCQEPLEQVQSALNAYAEFLESME
ncbi:MAG: hypothetical protein LUH07_12705 [Lachnospiraceae bacterium]|nr:hypothetical protein [Lachnospiraceae bacterium]